MKHSKSYKIAGIFYRTKAILRGNRIKKSGSAEIYSNCIDKYAGSELLCNDDCGAYISNAILSGEPFFAGRLGAFELLNMRHFDFGGFIGQKFDGNFHFNKLCLNAGFFPNDISLLPKFVYEMKEACAQVDLLGVWFNPFEDYYVRNNMNKPLLSYISNLEPWFNLNNPWSAALKGKKVLVIHPFEETIKGQYARREEIFPGIDILPEFDLKTLKAVQTVAGENDYRFDTWFDALEWMYLEALKIDFDIAIIGCGAYGFPLASKLKNAGRQAIHLGGATQLMFGIKGRRWDNHPIISKYYNDAWVRPLTTEVPNNNKKVENGCYW